MAKVKNISGEGLTVPALQGRAVWPDQVIEVEPDQVYGLTVCTQLWEPVDAAAKKAHKEGAQEEAQRVEDAAKPPDLGPDMFDVPPKSEES